MHQDSLLESTSTGARVGWGGGQFSLAKAMRTGGPGSYANLRMKIQKAHSGLGGEEGLVSKRRLGRQSRRGVDGWRCPLLTQNRDPKALFPCTHCEPKSKLSRLI